MWSLLLSISCLTTFDFNQQNVLIELSFFRCCCVCDTLEANDMTQTESIRRDLDQRHEVDRST